MTVDENKIMQQLRAENEQLRAELVELNTLKTQVASLEEIVGFAQCIFDQTSSSVTVYEVIGDGEDFLFKDINPAGEKMAGITKEKLLGQSLLEVFPGVSESGMLDVFREVWRSGTTNFYPPHAYSDKRINLWTEDTVIRLSSGDVVQICKDLTDSKELETKLRESEELYRTLIENAKAEIIVLGVDGSYKFVNQRYARYMGHSPSDFKAKSLRDFLPPTIADEKMAVLRRIVEARESQTIIDENVFHGKLHFHEMTLVPLLDDHKNVKSVMIVARDITPIKHAQDELMKQQEKMGRAERLASAGLISAMLSHELSQPLTVLQLSLQNLLYEQENKKETTTYDELNECLVQVTRLDQLMKRFRNFARTTHNPSIESVCIQTIFDKIIKLTSRLCIENKITIKLTGAETLPPIWATEADIEQLFFILIENSIHASDPNHDNTLNILCEIIEDNVVIQFADDCGGVARENEKQIFEPFFTTKEDSQGTGLGLCIAERIVKIAEGTLKVENRPGDGVTFSLSLPINVK